MKPVLNLSQNGYFIISPSDRKWEDIRFVPASAEPSLKTMQELVGGFIELISISNSADGIVNEEGKLLDLPFNPLATALYSNRDEIVGPMLILCGKARLK